MRAINSMDIGQGRRIIKNFYMNNLLKYTKEKFGEMTNLEIKL